MVSSDGAAFSVAVGTENTGVVVGFTVVVVEASFVVDNGVVGAALVVVRGALVFAEEKGVDVGFTAVL